MATRYDLTGSVAFVTGASGGIGAATARALHDRGARLALTDLDGAAVEQFAASFPPDQVVHHALDVTDLAATRRVVGEVVDRFGRLDVVFANAGIAPRTVSTMATTDESEFERIIEVDLLGVWRTIRATLPHVIEARGQIVLTGSIYCYMNGAANAAYAASKAGVEQLGRALRVELAGTGATASVLYPGWIRTPLSHLAFGGDELATELVRRLYRGPLGRLVEPEVVADAVVRGLERRAPRIHTPRLWRAVSGLRGLVAVAGDAYLDRDTVVHERLRVIEARARQGASRHEGASRSSGGGQGDDEPGAAVL